MGDYWLYWKDDPAGAKSFLEVDLLIRPMKGERLWFRYEGLDYETKIKGVTHVTESEDDYPRVELWLEKKQALNPVTGGEVEFELVEEDEEEEEGSPPNPRCQCAGLESIDGKVHM